MTRNEAEILLSRSLDGDLDASEAEQLRQALAADSSLRELAHQWEATRAALCNQVPSLSEMEIERQWLEIETALGEPLPGDGWGSLRFRQVAASLAAVICALFLIRGLPDSRVTPPASLSVSHGPEHAVEYVTTDIEGASPVVFVDEESGWAVIWIIEENEVSPRG